MPIHDWTRVTAGTWHAFHLAWIAEIQLALNGGLLPDDYYALAEQIAGPLGPDVLALQTSTRSPTGPSLVEPSRRRKRGSGAAPPRARYTAEAEMNDYVPAPHASSSATPAATASSP